MAMTKTVAGAVTTYVFTDTKGATATVAVTQGLGAGITCTLSSTGAFHQDGQQQLTNILQMVSTGLIP